VSWRQALCQPVNSCQCPSNDHLSIAVVVVASLIGAKGLGEDVLEALQYANVGQGILAGFAILFCAMILDRIVQGGKQ
jgi:glycine betaine/proline transport system permease protein